MTKKIQIVLINTIRSVLLMRIIKSVSIPVELAGKIEKIPNFSAYVTSVIQSDTEDKQTRRILALKRALARSHETMRLIQQLPQQMTRKAYMRSVFNLIDDRHGLDLERPFDSGDDE